MNSHQTIGILTAILALMLFVPPLINQHETNLKMQIEKQQLEQQLKETQIRFDAYREGNTAN
jgi:hypothetical protein